MNKAEAPRGATNDVDEISQTGEEPPRSTGPAATPTAHPWSDVNVKSHSSKFAGGLNFAPKKYEAPATTGTHSVGANSVLFP
jgi:hypothetical protein